MRSRRRRPCQLFGTPIPSDGVPLPIEPRLAVAAPDRAAPRPVDPAAERTPRMQVSPRLLALSAMLLPGCALPARASLLIYLLAVLAALLLLLLALLVSARRALQRERAAWWSWAAPLPEAFVGRLVAHAPRLPWQDGEAVHTSVGRPLPLAPEAHRLDEAEDLTQVNTTMGRIYPCDGGW